jgi:hypothetical protein
VSCLILKKGNIMIKEVVIGGLMIVLIGSHEDGAHVHENGPLSFNAGMVKEMYVSANSTIHF